MKAVVNSPCIMAELFLRGSALPCHSSGWTDPRCRRRRGAVAVGWRVPARAVAVCEGQRVSPRLVQHDHVPDLEAARQKHPFRHHVPREAQRPRNVVGHFLVSGSCFFLLGAAVCRVRAHRVRPPHVRRVASPQKQVGPGVNHGNRGVAPISGAVFHDFDSRTKPPKLAKHGRPKFGDHTTESAVKQLGRPRSEKIRVLKPGWRVAVDSPAHWKSPANVDDVNQYGAPPGVPVSAGPRTSSNCPRCPHGCSRFVYFKSELHRTRRALGRLFKLHAARPDMYMNRTDERELRG
mmetsp:Transcript_16612/g.30637  ORF Transcript_16612/g.30637 Transcript_16612/m.30637 type:complete len:292 (+) Transcript_16612:156-1031(+)